MRKIKIVNKEENKIIIAISSTKKYSYIWDAFFTMLRRYWLNCPYKIFFISDGNCEYLGEKYNITVYQMKKDIGFLNGYRYIAKNNNSKYIIILQEDFIIQDYVNNEKIEKCKQIMNNDSKIGFIRFTPNPGPKKNFKYYDGIEFGEIDKKDPFSFSYQASLWKCKFFLHITESSYSDPWVSENFLDKRMNSYTGDNYFLSFKKNNEKQDYWTDSVIPYKPTAISEGKLTYFAKELFRKENIVLNYIPEYYYHKKIN